VATTENVPGCGTSISTRAAFADEDATEASRFARVIGPKMQ
jgi:hypothetical protein